jgi:mediator of RNA polymerase II transcription subunit 12
MTSRPGAGVRESLQRRGSGGLQRPQGRRQAPQYGSLNSAYIADCIDPALDEQRRPAEQVLGKSRMQVNTIGKSPAASEGIQSLSNDGARPVPKGKPQIFFNDTGHTTSETALQPPHGQLGNAAAASLPLPPRPGHSRLTEASQLQRILPGGTGVKETASLKAPNNDPPPAACVFPGGSKYNQAYLQYAS